MFGHGVTLKGIYHPEFGYTFLLNSATTSAAVYKAMSMDNTANTAKLAADGDRLLGWLFSFEDRQNEGVKVGAIRTKGAVELPKKSGETWALGQSVVGGGAGTVKPAASGVVNNTVVVEIKTDTVVVLFN